MGMTMAIYSIRRPSFIHAALVDAKNQLLLAPFKGWQMRCQCHGQVLRRFSGMIAGPGVEKLRLVRRN